MRYIKSRHKTNNLPTLISCTHIARGRLRLIRPSPCSIYVRLLARTTTSTLLDFGGKTGAKSWSVCHKAIIFARWHDNEADASRQIPRAISGKVAPCLPSGKNWRENLSEETCAQFCLFRVQWKSRQHNNKLKMCKWSYHKALKGAIAMDFLGNCIYSINTCAQGTVTESYTMYFLDGKQEAESKK